MKRQSNASLSRFDSELPKRFAGKKKMNTNEKCKNDAEEHRYTGARSTELL